MIRTHTASIRTQLIVGYSDILNKARKGVDGLILPYFYCIMLVGDNSGLSCVELAELKHGKRSAMYRKLFRVIRAGFIYKENKRYYLTDSGAKVYGTICKEFEPLYKDIISVLTTEARKHL